MKTAVYITKNKIWAGELSFDWDGVSFDEVFGKIKKELKLYEMRIVLGNDVSFVMAVKAGDTFLSRENVLNMIKPWMPFEINNECFDWKEIVLSYDEKWLQIIALKQEFLYSLSSAIKKHGLKVELITAIGILLGEITKGREVPVILRWNNKENLSVLGINGLVDLVVSDIKEEDLMVYTTQKWGLAVNPEEIILKEENYNLTEVVFSEKINGEDKFVLNLPILKDVSVPIQTEDEKPEENIYLKKIGKESVSKLWIYLLIIFFCMLVEIAVMFWQGTIKSVFPQKNDQAKVLTTTPTMEITLEAKPINLADYSLKVLNGSGVTGEATTIKKHY